MPEKTPCSVSKVVSILKTSNIPKERLENKNYDLKGGICKDTRYGWVSWGPHFEVLNVSTGEKVAGWRFGTSRIELGTKVLCAVELPSTDGPLSVGQFVVGLEWEFVEGMVCIFDSQCSRLLRAIRIPERVISLSVVDGGTGGCEGRYPLPGLLSSMSGIIAAGLEGGKVLLIDLCRISSDELLTSWFSDDREEVRDELYPCQLVPINRNDNESEKLEVKRAEAARTGNHLSLLLNETAIVLDNFWLMGPAGQNRVLFQKQHVAVTSLLYVPRIASLVVGFNFSCFQIWNLMHLKLNFTSSLLGDPLPVIHLGFQEPSDDPRNFCYLWAVHSCTDSYPSSSNPIGFMYALCYESKEWVDGYGYLYQDYQSCSVRFEYELPNDCTDSITSSRCVSYHTLSNATPIPRSLLEDDYDEAGLENNLSLCLFMWEVYGSTGKPHSTFLSLFDLDQWYKDQMPHNVLDVDEDPAPCYLAMFSLEDVRQNASQSSTVSNPLLDIRIDPKSVAQFKSFQSLEEHFHPAALSFDSVCLLGQDVVFVDHPGIQRHVLMQMEREGPLSILHPTKLFRHCLNIGLKPILSEITSTLVSSINEQRDFLLSVALENQMLGFLFHCAAEWSSGAQSVAGCTLYVLLQWAWQRATTLKQEADRICVPLFDHSVRRLCRNESGNLESCVNQLHHLATLFTGINSDYTFPDVDLIKDLEQKTNSLQLAALYFEVVQWFCNVGLLPEFPEEEIVEDEIWFQKVPYPVTKFVKIYQKRRNELEQLSAKSNTEVRLFIDELLQHENEAEKLKSLWRQDGGSGSYPPPSLQSLLGTYQVDGIETRIKHSIVIYVFLDLAALLDNNKYGKAIDYFIKFPSAFCMSPSIIKVTQAFWLLDHKNFEEALDMVLDPLVAPADLQPWQHRYIVQAFLCQGHESKALDYFSVRKLPVSTEEDIRLKMTLLVVNRQITEAYHFLRQHQNEDNYHILLNHFFGDCRRVNGLGMVLKLFLTPMEEDAFMKFLDSCQHSNAEDMHIVYYLMRSRIIEAIDANEKIRLQDTHRQYPGGRCVRDILVNGYSKTLPNVTRQLAQYCAKEKKAFKNWRQVNRPTPLSVDIHQGSSQSVCYKSSLIRATFEKARETWFLPLTSHFTPVSKEKENSDGASLQNMPFLCIPQDGLRHDREITPVVYPTRTSSVMKRLREDDGDTPSKRSRLQDNSAHSFSTMEQKRLDYYSSRDSTLLLKSPHVERIPPRKPFKDQSSMVKNGTSGSLGDAFTPQSILKVRNLVRRSLTPENESLISGTSGNSTTPELLEEKLEEEKPTPSARQIRFSFPAPETPEEISPPSTPSPPSTTTSLDRASSSRRIISVTPRQALHSTPRKSAVHFNFPKTDTVYSQSPVRQKQSPVRQEQSPVRQEQSPLRQEQSPVRQEQSHVRQEQTPVRQEQTPVRQEQAPVRQEQSPIRQEVYPVRQEQSPVRLKLSPVSLKLSPVSLKLSPVRPKQSPVRPEQSPVRPEQSPVRPEQSPVRPEQLPVRLEQSLVRLEQSPVRLEQSPVRLEQSPVRLEQSPVRLEQSPVRLKLSPVRPEQSPVRPEQLPERLEQFLVRLEQSPVKPKQSLVKPEQSPPVKAEQVPTALSLKRKSIRGAFESSSSIQQPLHTSTYVKPPVPTSNISSEDNSNANDSMENDSFYSVSDNSDVSVISETAKESEEKSSVSYVSPPLKRPRVRSPIHERKSNTPSIPRSTPQKISPIKDTKSNTPSIPRSTPQKRSPIKETKNKKIISTVEHLVSHVESKTCDSLTSYRYENSQSLLQSGTLPSVKDKYTMKDMVHTFHSTEEMKTSEVKNYERKSPDKGYGILVHNSYLEFSDDSTQEDELEEKDSDNTLECTKEMNTSKKVESRGYRSNPVIFKSVVNNESSDKSEVKCSVNEAQTVKDREDDEVQTVKDKEDDVQTVKDKEDDDVQTVKDREDDDVQTVKDREDDDVQTVKDKEDDVQTVKDREDDDVQTVKDREEEVEEEKQKVMDSKEEMQAADGSEEGQAVKSRDEAIQAVNDNEQEMQTVTVKDSEELKTGQEIEGVVHIIEDDQTHHTVEQLREITPMNDLSIVQEHHTIDITYVDGLKTSNKVNNNAPIVIEEQVLDCCNTGENEDIIVINYSSNDGDDICIIDNAEVELGQSEEEKTYETLAPVEVEVVSDDVLVLDEVESFEDEDDQSNGFDVSQQLPDLLSVMEEQDGQQSEVRDCTPSSAASGAVELPDVLLRTVDSNSDDSSSGSYPSSTDVEQEQTEEEELVVIEDTSLEKTEDKGNNRRQEAGDSKLAICEEIVILDSDSDPGLEGRDSHTADVQTVEVVEASFCERGEDDNTIGKSKSDNNTDLVANENVSTSSSLTHSNTSITKQDDGIRKSSRANELEVVMNVDKETYAKRLIVEQSDDNETNISHVTFEIFSHAEKLVQSANNDSVQVAENNEISMLAMNVENNEHVSAVTGTVQAGIMPISETVTNAIETRDAVDIKYELHGTVVKILSSALIDVDIALEGREIHKNPEPIENKLGQSKLSEFDVRKVVIESSKHKESATTDVNIPTQVSDNILGKEIESVEEECISVLRKSPELQDDCEKQPSQNVFATRSVKSLSGSSECEHAQLCQVVEENVSVRKVECASSEFDVEDHPEHETETRDIESQTSIRPFKDIECQTSFVFSGPSNAHKTLEDKCLQSDLVRDNESETIFSQTEPQKVSDVIEKDINCESVSESTTTVQNESASVDIITKDAHPEMSSRQSESLKCSGVVEGEHASCTIESLHDNTSKLSDTVQSGDIPLKKDCKTASEMACIESESFKNSDITEVAEEIVLTETIPREVGSGTSPNLNELSKVSDVLRLSNVVDKQTSELPSPLGVTDEQISKSVEDSYVVEDNTSKAVEASTSPSKINEPAKFDVSVADNSLQKRKSIRRRHSVSHEQHSLHSDDTEDISHREKRTKRSKSDSSSTQSEPCKLCDVLEDNIVGNETLPKNAKSSACSVQSESPNKSAIFEEQTIETRSGTTSQCKISSIKKRSHKKLLQSKRQNQYSKHSSSCIPENTSEKIPLGTKLNTITEEHQVSSSANLQVDVVGENQENSIVTRSRKKASSVTSETSSVCDFKDSVGETWYGRTRKTSVSDSSKSTLIFGEASEELHDNLRSVKRKRRSSISSNVSAVSDVTTDSKVGKGRGKKSTSSPDRVDQEKEQLIKTSEQSQQEVMEEYATARRLTRHQRSLLERSLEMSNLNQQSRHHRRQPGKAGVDSDESSDSSIAIRGCIPSSSVSQPQHTDVTAVMEHSTSALQVTPTKREAFVRRSRRSIGKPTERHVDSELSSPASVTSEMSTEYASSVTSTQSHLLHSPASIQSEDFVGRRRKSFQKAHRILMQSPAKARSLSGKDSSGSIEEEGLPVPGGSRRHSLRLSLGNDPQDPMLSSLAEPSTSADVDDDSDAESVISQSSVVSVGGRRYSRYSLRSLDLDIQRLQKSPGSLPIDDKDENSPSTFSFSQPTVIPKAVENETDEKSDPVPTFVFSPPQTRLQHSQSRSRSSNVRISQLAPTLQTIEEEEPSSSSSKASSAVEKSTSSTVTRSKKSRSKSSGSSSTASFHKRRSNAFNFFSPTSEKEKADADVPPNEETYRPTPTIGQRKRMTKMRSSREVYTALKVRKSFSVKPRRK